MSGYIVPKLSSITEDNIELALGFIPPSTDVDVNLPKGEETFMFRFGKPLAKGNDAAKVMVYTSSNASIIYRLKTQKLPEELSMFKEVFFVPQDGEDLVIKVTPVDTIRKVMTCFKEAKMNHRIFNTCKNGADGKNLVCKPFMCTLVYQKTGWHFVFVTTLCHGQTVSKLSSVFGRLLYGVSKKKMGADLTKACDDLWKLGFAHNDLHPRNIIYNPKTSSVTFIDLETAVEVEPEVNAKYIQSRLYDSDVVCHITFKKVMLSNALDLLRLSEEYVEDFTTQYEGESKLLFNTDCDFLAYYHI